MRVALGRILLLGVALATGFPTAAGVPVQQIKLLAHDGQPEDRFGRSVVVRGNTALVGAPRDFNTDFIDFGQVYVYTRPGTQWVFSANLVPPTEFGGALFGIDVDLDGDTALVGASRDGDNGTYAGAAYVFVRSAGIWTQQAKLLAEDGAAQDRFGFKLALEGDTAVIGASGNNNENGGGAGAVYVFVRSGAAWTQQAKLLASDGDGGDRFGASVALDNGTLVVGADWDEPSGIRSGSAYVFTGAGASWTEEAKLVAPDGGEFEHFGQRVDVDGDTAIITAPGHPVTELTTGSAYFYERIGGVWIEQAKLQPSNGNLGDGYGWSVELHGNRALVGAIAADGNSGGSGAAYLLSREAGRWSEHGVLFPDDGALGDAFGDAVSLDGTFALIGAPGDDDLGPIAGSAYIFEVPDDDAVPATTTTGAVLLVLLFVGLAAYGRRSGLRSPS